MKKIRILYALLCLTVLSSCNDDEIYDGVDQVYTAAMRGMEIPGNGNPHLAGYVTAGEWNDLKNWTFWIDLINEQAYAEKQDYWKFYTNNRVAVEVKSNGAAVVNAKVDLFKSDSLVWTSRTDNKGEANLWVHLFDYSVSVNMQQYSLKVNDQLQASEVLLFDDGVNSFELPNSLPYSKVEVSFIVDATGSMGDEIDFLKSDLDSVITQIQNENSNLNILTSSVFYRDIGAEYVVKKSGFSNNLQETVNFINEQSAHGGGDVPEAVEIALEVALDELQWSENAKTRIAFLLLDAPPHYKSDIIDNIHVLIKEFAKKGIKIIPIAASGIDKETEFLMRFFSIATNGSYIFITDDSGYGDQHLKASVGQYEVEKLNDLLVRIIKEYSN